MLLFIDLTKTIRLSSSCSGVVTLIHNDSYLLILCSGNYFFCQQPPENLGKRLNLLLKFYSQSNHLLL